MVSLAYVTLYLATLVWSKASKVEAIRDDIGADTVKEEHEGYCE